MQIGNKLAWQKWQFGKANFIKNEKRPIYSCPQLGMEKILLKSDIGTLKNRCITE